MISYRQYSHTQINKEDKVKIFDEFGNFIGTIVPEGCSFGGLIALFLGLTVFVFWAIYYFTKEGILLLKQGNMKGLLYILLVIIFLLFGWLVSAKG